MFELAKIIKSGQGVYVLENNFYETDKKTTNYSDYVCNYYNLIGNDN